MPQACSQPGLTAPAPLRAARSSPLALGLWGAQLRLPSAQVGRGTNDGHAGGARPPAGSRARRAIGL